MVGLFLALALTLTLTLTVLQASGPLVAMMRQQIEHTEVTEVMRQESHAALDTVSHTGLGSGSGSGSGLGFGLARRARCGKPHRAPAPD